MHPQQAPLGVREVLLLVGRLSFSDVGTAPFPSAIVVYDGITEAPRVTSWVPGPIQETLF